MWVVIHSLGGVHTHTHTNVCTEVLLRNQAPVRTWFNKNSQLNNGVTKLSHFFRSTWQPTIFINFVTQKFLCTSGMSNATCHTLYYYYCCIPFKNDTGYILSSSSIINVVPGTRSTHWTGSRFFRNSLVTFTTCKIPVCSHLTTTFSTEHEILIPWFNNNVPNTDAYTSI